MEIQEILSRFEDVTDKSDGYLARCSAHMDSRPSLVIFVGDDRKVRMHCRAGCETRDVIKAVGLRWADLFDSTGQGVTVPRDEPKPVGPMHTAPLMMWVAERQQEYYDDQAREYAERRFGITTEDASDLMLGFAGAHSFQYAGMAFMRFPRLVVPFLSFSGVVHGMQGRDISGQCPGRWVGLTNPEGHAWGKYGVMDRPSSDTIIVAEGPGDGLTAYAAGYSALVIRGAAMVRNEALRAEIAAGLAKLGKRVVAAGDNDKAGKQFTALCAEHFQADALTIPGKGKDLTAWREDNPGVFQRRIDRAIERSTPPGMSKAQAIRMRALLAAYTEEIQQ